MKKLIITLFTIGMFISANLYAAEPYLYLTKYTDIEDEVTNYYGKKFRIKRRKRKTYREVKVTFILREVPPYRKVQYMRVLCLFKFYAKSKSELFAKFGKQDYCQVRKNTVGEDICYSAGAIASRK